MKNIYLLSGLGIDHSVFQKLDFGENHIHQIPWIKPKSKDESIEDYAARLTSYIKHENPVLIGLSFGGMMAIEIAKLIKTEKLILLSTAKTNVEFPIQIQCIRFLKLHKLFPLTWLKSNNFITNWIFGATTKSDKKYLTKVLLEIDNSVLIWSVNAILKWKNQTILNNIVHIHGSNDHIFTKGKNFCNYTIKDGGHLMILDKSKEINKLINKIIQ